MLSNYLIILVADLILHDLMAIEFIPVIVEQFYFLKSKIKQTDLQMYVKIATHVAESRCIGERKDIFFLNFIIQ